MFFWHKEPLWENEYRMVNRSISTEEEKFPLLFKRAIPFRMNIKPEDFVKEYICMAQDIHIEDM